MTTAIPASIAEGVTLERLYLAYGNKTVVEGVTGIISGGALLALVGPNGAGKSTLLKALAGLHRPAAGTIDGNAAAGVRPAYMPQNSEIDRAFPMTVLDFVAMGLWREIGFWKPVSRRQIERSRTALARVGLDGTERQRVGTLSGGQLRRALFARASLQDAPLVLLDEPFAGIDAATANDLIEMIRGWHAEGRTVIAALHDLDQVRAHFPATLLLARRVIGWGDSRTVLNDVNLAMARAVCASANDDGVRGAEPSDRRADV